jgi:hypothetical protein
MDLGSNSITARPVGLENLTTDDWATYLPSATGLVIVYDGQTPITERMQGVLHEMHPKCPVVFVRSRTSRFPPELFVFYVVPLFEGRTSSYYQPHRKGRGGFADVIGFLGGGTPAKDTRRPGFAFLSYSSRDRPFVNEQLVPALAACNIGFFDYRFTERLNERNLKEEIERRIKRCALMVACTSGNWRNSKYAILECTLARKLGRPIVAVTPRREATALAFPATTCLFRGKPEADRVALKRAIGRALPAIMGPA